MASLQVAVLGGSSCQNICGSVLESVTNRNITLFFLGLEVNIVTLSFLALDSCKVSWGSLHFTIFI